MKPQRVIFVEGYLSNRAKVDMANGTFMSMFQEPAPSPYKRDPNAPKRRAMTTCFLASRDREKTPCK